MIEEIKQKSVARLLRQLALAIEEGGDVPDYLLIVEGEDQEGRHFKLAKRYQENFYPLLGAVEQIKFEMLYEAETGRVE